MVLEQLDSNRQKKKKKSKPHIIKTNQKTEMEHGLKDTYKTIKPLEKTG